MPFFMKENIDADLCHILSLEPFNVVKAVNYV